MIKMINYGENFKTIDPRHNSLVDFLKERNHDLTSKNQLLNIYQALFTPFILPSSSHLIQNMRVIEVSDYALCETALCYSYLL